MGFRRGRGTDFVLRVGGGFDSDVLAELWVASWREAMPHIDFCARRQWFEARLRALEASGAVTICGFDTSDRVAGFITLDPANGYIDQLAAEPSAKGSGVATLLLDEARRLSTKPLWLDVNVENSRAVNFYQRQGFTSIGQGINPGSGLATRRLALASQRA